MFRKKQIEKQQVVAAADSPQSAHHSKPILLSKVQIQELIQKELSLPIEKHSVAEEEINGKGDDCSISSLSTGTTNYFLYISTDINLPDINNFLNIEIRLSSQIITPVQKLQIINMRDNRFVKQPSTENDEDNDDGPCEALNSPSENSPNYTHYKFGLTISMEYPSKGFSVQLLTAYGRGMSKGVTNSLSHSFQSAAGAKMIEDNLHQNFVKLELEKLQAENITSFPEAVKRLKKIVFDAEKKTFESQKSDALSMIIGDNREALHMLEKAYYLPQYDSVVTEDKVIDRRHNYVMRLCHFNNQQYAVRTVIFSKPEQLESWKKEALLLCILKHQSIVDHIGYGLRQEKFQFKLLMEHCKNGFLYDVLFKPPPKKKNTEITYQIKDNLKQRENIYRVALSAANALHYLHTEKKMIYVNVSSSSIMLSDDYSCKFLVDSSTCYVCNTDLESSQLVIPHSLIKYYNPNVSAAENAVLVQYKSPEQILLSKGKYGLSSAVDIFAFGIVLYEIFTHINPWKGHNPKVILERVARGERPELSSDMILVSEQNEIVNLISWCWKQDPIERPSISQVLLALGALFGKQ